VKAPSVNARGLATAILSAVVAIGGPAQAGETVRIRGSARFEASATLDQERVVVAGAVVDDIGRPVGGGAVTVDLETADGRALSGIVPLSCPGPRGTRAEGTPVRLLRIEPDRAGRFCALFPGEVKRVALTFVDERGFFDPSSQKLTVDTNRQSIAVRFVEPPATLELEREEQRLTIAARSDAVLSAPAAPLPVAIYAREATAGGPPELVAQDVCELGQSVTLPFPSAKLSTPGPIDLSVRFSGSERFLPAEARIRLHATTRVTLALSRPVEPGDPGRGIELDVAVATPKGAVTSGAVEATLGGRTVGIARVERGTARVTVRFPRSPRPPRVELRYLPNEPWWRPGTPLLVEVPIAPRGPWGTVVWLLLLALVAIYLMQSWRRPRSEARPAPPKAGREPRPSVVMVESDQSQSLWRGSVRDAHEGTPIVGAEIEVFLEGPERRVIARAVADPNGEFELVSPASAAGMVFSVRAPLHSELVSEAPGFGRVRVDLVTRRRHLLGRLARWAGRRAFGRGRGELTPGEVARHAKKAEQTDVAEWAGRVESAAYGPTPVDEHAEREVVRREPPDAAGPAGGSR